MVTALLLMLASAAPAEPANPAVALPVWMAGCWITEADAEGRRSEECWTVPRGAMMLGSGHHFNGTQTMTFEHMRIERVDGSLVFVAQPGGEPPTRFPLHMADAGVDSDAGVQFVNVDNDYPQRVRYWRDGDMLMAEIAFIDGRDPVRWRFRRA